MGESTTPQLPPAPSVWSLEYHLRFVPALIAWRLRPAPARSGFGPHFNILVPIVAVVCLTLLGNGVVSLVDDGPSASAAILSILGGGGLVALLAMSIADQRDEPTGYDRFVPAIFFLCIVLGATVGVFVMRIGWRDVTGGAMWAAIAGTTVFGYVVGLPAGYWWQRLGTVGSLLAILAYPAMIGMVVTDLLLLSG